MVILENECRLDIVIDLIFHSESDGKAHFTTFQN
jgi:hypothetical protein